MRSLLAFALAAIAASVAVPASAQEARIEPRLAKQCSLWASYAVSTEQDANVRQVIQFAMTYFSGYYEGATGRAVGDTRDEEALAEVSDDLPRFRQLCMAEMQRYSARMVQWGQDLVEIGSGQPAN